MFNRTTAPESENGHTALIAILTTCTFFVGLDDIIVVPLIPAIAESTDVPVDVGILLVTTYAGAFMLSAPVFGAISDRWGRKKLIFAGMGLLGAATALTGTGNSLVSLLVFRVFAGVGAGMIQPSVYALVGDVFAYEERGRAMGIVTAGFIVSTVFGIPLGSYVAALTTWSWTFWTIAVGAVVMLGVIYVGLPATRPSNAVSSPFRSVATQFRTAVSNRSVFGAVMTSFLWAGGLYAVFGSIGVYYATNFGLHTASVGTILLIAGVASTIGSVVGGALSDRFGKKIVIGFAALIAAAGVIGLSFLTHALLLAIGLNVIWAAADGNGQAVIQALVSELDPEARGTVLSLNSSFRYGGIAVATALSAVLLQSGDFAFVGVISGVATLAVVPIVWYWVDEHRSGASEAEPSVASADTDAGDS